MSDLQKLTLGEAYVSIPRKDQDEIRETIIEKCGWHRQTFYNKTNARTKIKPPELNTLNEIFKPYNIQIVV